MRAGLLSNEALVDRINDTFVCTWILIDDAERRGKQGDSLAQTLADHWEFPLDLMFLTPQGRLVTKLNSFRHLRRAAPDVGHPPEGRGLDAPHEQVVEELLDRHFSRPE